MRKPQKQDIAEVLAELRAQVADLASRLAALEAGVASGTPPLALSLSKGEGVPSPSPAPAAAAPAPSAITEEELLAVSAALAAYFGVRMRIRSIRLTGSPVWAQQGRVSIQASHRLHS